MSLQASNIIHIIFPCLCFPVCLIFAALHGQRYGYDRKKAVIYTGIVLAIAALFTYASQWVCSWLGYRIHLNSYRSALFIPLFTWMFSRIWKIPALNGADFVIPSIFFARATIMIGCNIVGCATAIPCDWGPYSLNMGCRVFPVDLIDCVSSMVLGILAMIYAKKLNYKGDGRIYAFAMYTLGIVRLFLQFGSRESWFGIRGFNDESVYSIIAMIMAIFIYHRNDQEKNVN